MSRPAYAENDMSSNIFNCYWPSKWMKVVHLVRMNTLISLLSWIQNAVIKVGDGYGILQQTGNEKIYRNIASTDPHHVVPSISNTSKVNPSWSETQCENDWFKNLNKKRILTFHISFVVFGTYDFKLSVTTIESNKYHLEISFSANTTFDIFYCGTIRHKQRLNRPRLIWKVSHF